jgi:hypothetical protein
MLAVRRDRLVESQEGLKEHETVVVVNCAYYRLCRISRRVENQSLYQQASHATTLVDVESQEGLKLYLVYNEAKNVVQHDR